MTNKTSSSYALDFDDVLIKPKFGGLSSRSEVSLLNRFREMPVVASNIDSVGTISVAKEFYNYQCKTYLHKHYPLQTLLDFFSTRESDYSVYTMGVVDSDVEKFKEFVKLFPHEFFPPVCIDVANGYMKDFSVKIQKVIDIILSYKFFPKIVVGNVCTPDVIQLIYNKIGLNFGIKIGIGPSKTFCKTREVTGVGYPQLQAILDCRQFLESNNLIGRIKIIADGGCKNPGDVCKAIAAGADEVMIGGLFAASDESEKPIIDIDGKRYIESYGMSSKQAMEKYEHKMKTYRASEGRYSLIECRGPVKHLLEEVLGGIRSFCTYSNIEKVADAYELAEFVKVNRQQ